MNPGNNSQTTRIITFEKNGHSTEIVPHKIKYFPIFNKVADRKVYIISICGPMRNGRTLLLNFILRYVKAFQEGNEDILGCYDPDAALEGFAWGGGNARMTTGIWITTEPIMLFNSKGEEIVVFLMDTEGLLDNQNTSASLETKFILDICFQLSAAIIFNVNGCLIEEQLNVLGNAAQKSENNGNKNLTVLVRDWAQNAEFQHGEIGGQLYKNKTLSQMSDTGNFGKSKEALSGLRQFDCFLLANPGKGVHNENYNGNLAGFEPQFLSQLETFLLNLLDSNSLTTNQLPLTGKNCIQLIERTVRKYAATGYGLHSETVQKRDPEPTVAPTPVSRKSNPEGIFKELSFKIIDEYKSSITNSISETKHGFLPPSVLKEHQQGYFDLAVQQLTNFDLGVSLKIGLAFKEQLEADLGRIFQVIWGTNNNKYTEFLKKWDGTLNDCVELYKEETKVLFTISRMTESLAKIKNKLQVKEILLKFEMLLGSLSEDKELLQEYSDKLESEASAIFNIEMQAFLTIADNTRTREFQNCLQTAEAEYTQVMNRLTRQNLNSWNSAELEEFHIKAVNEVLIRANIPKGNDNLGNSYENQLRHTLNANLNSMLGKKNDLASAKEKFVTPAYNDFCGKVSNLIGNFKSKSLRQFEEDLKNLKAEVCEELKSKVQRTEEDFIVIALLEQLKSNLDNDTQNDIKEFIKKKQMADEEKAIMFQSILQEYRTKMERKLQNDAHGNLSMAGLTSTHEETKSKLIRDLEAKSMNSELSFELTYEFKSQALQGCDKIFNELQGIQNDKRRAADARVAQNLIQTYAQKYQHEINNTQWKDLNELENYQGDIMTGEAQLIKDFKINCPNKDREFFNKFLDKLQAELSSIFSKELPQMQLKFEHLKIKSEQEEIMLKTKILDSTKYYENEMEKHFRDKSFLPPAEFRQYHESLVVRILQRFGENLTDFQKTKLRESLTPLYEKYNEINTMNTPGNDVAIGIDLGTTYSCVGIYHQGQVRIITNEFGTKTVPSFVAYTAAGEKVGHAAKEQAHETPTETIFDAKRLIGRTMDDEQVKKDIKYWPFKVVAEAGGNNPVIMVNDVPRIPEFISARILKHLKEMVERYLQGKKITKAVITVPAYFTDGQRQATIHAGEIAGLDVLRIINEPTAAAMAYHLHQASTNTLGRNVNVLVYDLGGGTFDVSVLSMEKGVIKVLSTKGNTHLGGEDFDGKMIEFCVQEFKKVHGIDLSVGIGTTEQVKAVKAAKQLRRLRAECEKRKKDLSSCGSSAIILDAIVDGKDLNIPITRKQFEDMNQSSFEETIQIVKQALADAKLLPNQIDEIVLVGGSSRIPKIQEMLKEFFGGKALNSQLDPDEAVARGAAILAAKLNGEEEQKLKRMSLEDVAPLSIGIKVKDGTNNIIIPKNTSIPADYTKEYTTAEDNQTAVTISIYEGEQKMAKDNHLLGEFILSNIPSNMKGVEKIDVTMQINEQGILNVTAKCLSTGIKNEIAIQENKGRLTKEDIERYCNELG